MSELIYAYDPVIELKRLLNRIEHDKIFVITDSNVRRLFFKDGGSDIGNFLDSITDKIITFTAGEINKNINTVCDIWGSLSCGGATRKSLVINFGGGVTTDMGSFAASTFKRGVGYINIPTTLLSIVDASVGGKTGIDFSGLKNEIGTFAFPKVTMVCTQFLKTLPTRQVLSGMGEVVKMSMLRSRDCYMSIIKDFEPTDDIIRKCIEWKLEITAADPRESGLRKLLNFGHTAGHAFESILTDRGKDSISHGACVAHGIMVALILSHMLLKMPSSLIYEYKTAILSNYSAVNLTCKDRDLIMEKIAHDKKNSGNEMKLVLLRDIAQPVFDVSVSRVDLESALDIYLMNDF